MRGTTRTGSLFTGAAALDLAAHQIFDAQPAWFVENDPAATRVLAHNFPDTPNHGDITTVDWATVEPVEILCGGFPCQDISTAGKRAGMRPDTRSGLWSHMRYAISQLQPELVIIENVRGLLSAGAHCDLEPCTWCLGDNEGRPLRALGAVLGDLAQLGYDAQWHGLRAADVGAPHGRFRIVITAWPATGVLAGQERTGESERTQRQRNRDTPRDGRSSTQDANSPAGREWWPTEPGETQGGRSRTDAGRRGGESPTDTIGTGWQTRSRIHQPTRPATIRDDPPAHNPRTWIAPDGTDYGPAIHRWETILGRAAPEPTQTGARGGQKLSATFCEWMMGWPQGWVTDVPGVSVSDQIKICGNGAVPHQAAAALRHLLTLHAA